MKIGTDPFEQPHAGAGYAHMPARVPFVDLVEPFSYVGEEVVRLGTAIARAAINAASVVQRRWNQHTTMKALQALEDHRLEDIGVRREEIAELARKLAHG
jgi:uncharacterized protein YjiS (DUF1127 family)